MREDIKSGNEATPFEVVCIDPDTPVIAEIGDIALRADERPIAAMKNCGRKVFTDSGGSSKNVYLVPGRPRTISMRSIRSRDQVNQ